MHSMALRRLLGLLALFGLDLRKFAQSARGLRPYFQNRVVLKRQIAASGPSSDDFPITQSHPCLSDRRAQSWVPRGARAYFHQDLHVAQLIYANRPESHVDVGSRVDGFVAQVASF